MKKDRLGVIPSLKDQALFSSKVPEGFGGVLYVRGVGIVDSSGFRKEKE